MNGFLLVVNAVLAAAILAMATFILVIRVVVSRRLRRDLRFQPSAESALADYVAGGDEPAAPTERDERAVLLAVAIDALSDLRGAERARLVVLLEKLGYVDDAISGLRARRRVTRRRAAETLSAIGPPTAAPGLRAGLRDSDALVRTTCARTLAEVGPGDDVPAITAIAEQDAPKVPGAAAAVVLALAEHRPGALAPLLSRDAPAEGRFVALTLAGEMRLAEHAPLLLACLDDRDDLAVPAARGLGLIGVADAVGPLREVMCDEGRGRDVRAAATQALGALGQPGSVPALETQLQAGDWVLQAAAAQALARMGEPGKAALRRAAAAGRAEARELAEAALAP
jgi:HEAT repeat protein